MLDTAYIVAGFLALIGGLCGNRIAWPLLASFAFCQVARWQGWEFDRDLWQAVDLATLLGITVVLGWTAFRNPDWRITNSDVAVVLLFAPMLASYGLEPPERYYLSMAAGISQLLLVFPAKRVWQGLRASANDIVDRRDEFDLRAMA